LEYAVSVAATNGDFALDALRLERLNDSQVMEMSSRIRWIPDDDQDRYGTIEPGDVNVVLTDGREIRRQVDHSLGHPDMPMPRERRARKLVSCAVQAGMTWSEDSALGYLDRIDHLWSAASSSDVWALPPG
jgi:2-methylcitrate dehydratase PrpD